MSLNTCEYCGKPNPKPNTCIIGAKRNTDSEDFVMVYGTGKMSCRECYPKALEEAKATIEKHIPGS